MGKRTNSKRGFTIVEVTLVLAITSLLVVGLMSGTSASLARQRYSDAMVEISEKLRQIYSEVVSVQNTRSGLSENAYCSVSSIFGSEGNILPNADVTPSAPGRTKCAIYGKLVTIGERIDDTISNDIRVYDIVGDIYSPDDFKDSTERNAAENAEDQDFTKSTEATERVGFDSDANIKTLKKIGANSVTLASKDINGATGCGLAPINEELPYEPPWNTSFETTSDEHKKFRGALVIFRSPLSGTVQTYYADYSDTDVNYDGDGHLPIDINYMVSKVNDIPGNCTDTTNDTQLSNTFFRYSDDFLQGILKDAELVTGTKDGDEDLTICVNSDESYYLGGRRRGIRILKTGRNATAVELLNSDILKTGEDNPCQ